MHSVSTLVASVGLAIGASVSTVTWLAPRSANDEDARQELDALRLELATMRQRLVTQEDLRSALMDTTRLEVRERMVEPSPARNQPAVAVTREESAGERRMEALPPVEPDAKSEEPRTLEAWLEAVQGSRGDFDATGELWKKILAEGRFDDVIAALRELAEVQPNNPDARLDLGNAFLQRVFSENGPTRGIYAAQADQSFDAALRIDPTHWSARFTKAVALANWPAAMGKTGGAIREFETLIEQQRGRTPEPHHARPYYFLGNLYLSRGQLDRAREVWNQGLALFPQDRDLRQQIETNR